MALEVEIQRPSGVEVKKVGDLSGLMGIVGEFLSGQADKITARPDNNVLVPLIRRINDDTQSVPLPIVEIVARNNGTMERLVKQHGIYILAAAAALSKAGYGSDTALANTAKALADFGTRPTLMALEQHPSAIEIYNATKAEVGRAQRYMPT